MASQNSFVPYDVNLHFVVSEKYESEDECSEHMWETYNACVQNELQPRWVDEEECRAIKPQKNDVFVMEEFEGDLFKALQKSKCVIVGPRCLLSCFHACEPIPDGPHPVFTNAMRGMVVSISGLATPMKEKIGMKVRYMGGIYSKQMRGSTTHLISDSVMSAKYEEAVGLKIPVMTERWVEAVWEINLKDYVAADDPQFEKYRCPVFMKLVATTTHLPKRQKEEVKKLIDKHGGTCMGALDGTKVKVVVAPKNCPISDKLKYARENNIACLDVAWVYESIETGYSLPFNKYLVKCKNTSTPEKRHASNDTLNFSAISMIPCEPRSSSAFVDETVATIANNTCNVTEISAVDRRSIAAQNTVLDKLDVREAKLAGPFLDGCNIYLAGFPSNQRDKINRILNAGSATRLDDISDALTHVIVGDETKAANEIKVMKSKGLNPYILSLDWLEESIKLKRAAPEENYSHEMKQISNARPAEPPSPLSKKNIQMLQRPKKPPVPRFDIDKEVSFQKPEEWDEGEEESSLMKQYLQKATGENYAAERSFQEFLQPHNRTPDSSTASKVSSDTAKSFALSRTLVTAETPNQSTDDSNIPFSQQTLQFNGLTFLITGFDKEDTDTHTASIEALGGKIVSNSFVGVPDYGLVPLTGAPLKHAVDEVVTDLYIDDCVENQSVVQLQDYHRPLSISTDVKPLADCVIATSSYTGIKRAYLTRVAEALGALYQDTFARKTNAEKALVASTHLLCPTPEGGKYAAAIKWKIPAVTSDWLMACAAKMRLVSEVPYLVGEAVAPERPEEPADASFMGPPAMPTPRTISTPKRHLPRLQGQATQGYDTPLVNKRISSVLSNTPTSPFHVATPDTPYGQVYKSNPSPETRKAWKKWIDNFPDLRVDEPPLKRRAPSTPLSELRRQFWSTVNNEPLHAKQKDEDFESPSHGAPRVSPRADPNHSVTSNADAERSEEKSPTPINRKLSFQEENSPAPKKQIDLHIEQLEQVLQAASNSTDSRYSLSGNAKIYNQEDLEAIDKCLVKDSQPETVGWEDPAHGGHYKPVEQAMEEEPEEVQQDEGEEEEEVTLPRKRKFMLSGVKDRSNYEKAILDLGGELSSEMNFDPTATHLLCIKPLRNEKLLGSIAAGNWVLHCSYLQHCQDEGKFIDEERFEWGNPQSQNVIPEPGSETEKSIAAAAHRWRLKLSDAPGGAFRDMVAMLLVPKEKYEQFERLIIAGSGVVVNAKPPYDSSPHGKKITHCFIQPKQLKQPVEWAMLASKGILCFQPQYLGEYLTAEIPLNPRDSVIAEFKKYLSLVPK